MVFSVMSEKIAKSLFLILLTCIYRSKRVDSTRDLILDINLYLFLFLLYFKPLDFITFFWVCSSFLTYDVISDHVCLLLHFFH